MIKIDKAKSAIDAQKEQIKMRESVRSGRGKLELDLIKTMKEDKKQ